MNFHWRAASADVFSFEAALVPNILMEIDLCAIGGDLVDESVHISGVTLIDNHSHLNSLPERTLSGDVSDKRPYPPVNHKHVLQYFND